MEDATCPLCISLGGTLVFQGEKFRVIRADEAGFPAFYRVVWTAHVAEFSDLSVPDRALCMVAVCEVEQALRAHLQPTKINLAALGNVVAHLHWHVIARFDWDTHFPVWAQAQRPLDVLRQDAVLAKLKLAERHMAAGLATFQATLT
jgi:diadenosine tetraphosphate (Ap4A) HIT family hydrolase